MREAGDVCYADVYKDGTGVVEFLRYEDMKYAVKKLDDSKFRSHEVSSMSSVWLFFSAVWISLGTIDNVILIADFFFMPYWQLF